MPDAHQPPRVELDYVDDIAVVTLDNPPVNSGNQRIRQGILDALAAIDTQRVRAVVLQGAGKHLMAGADLRELDQPATAPSLPEVTQALEAFPLPIVAVVRGHTLGGGLELALACDARLATPGASLGLPEVNVGIIPGAGGTQRLPRLVGVDHALTMIVAGKPIDAATAHQWGLVDQMLDTTERADQEVAALDFARRMPADKRRVSARSVPPFDADQSARLQAQQVRRQRGLPAAAEAADAVMIAARTPFAEGVAHERERFLALRDSEAAHALRYLFFAERANPLAELTAAPATLTRVSVIGAGTMGSGIALAALRAGYRVDLIERDAQALAAGVERIEKAQQQLIERRGTTATPLSELLSRLACSTQLAGVEQADLVIEAIVEDLEIKRSLFAELSRLTSSDTLLATNTSYLDIDAIAAEVAQPSRVLGLHFFSPADRMPLLEIVATARTDDTTLVTAHTFAKALKKTPIVVRNAWGFVGNRIYAAYRRQCEFMLEEGASPTQIDTALEAFGFAMGPFKVADMSGLDIAWKMRQATGAADADRRYVGLPDRLCEAGRFGRKTRQGYYRYDDSLQPSEDPEVMSMIDAYRQAQGIEPRAFSASEIQQRVVAALINEALLVIGEGVCRRAEDIDIALVNGYGFPRWRGGPVFIARQMPVEALATALDQLARASGRGHVAGDPVVLSTACSRESSHGPSESANRSKT